MANPNIGIGTEPYVGVAKEGKDLSDYDHLNRSAVATLDELAWWAHTPKAGRDQESRASEEIGAVLERRNG